MGLYFLGSALGDFYPEIKHGNPMAKLHDHFHVMFHDKDSDPFLINTSDKLHHGMFLFGVHTGYGFIQHQKFRLGSQGNGNPQDTLVTMRQIDSLNILDGLQSAKSQQFIGFFPDLFPFTSNGGRINQITEETDARIQMIAHEDILGHGKIVKKDIALKGPDQPHFSDSVRLQSGYVGFLESHRTL